jgi:hypothetical protein
MCVGQPHSRKFSLMEVLTFLKNIEAGCNSDSHCVGSVAPACISWKIRRHQTSRGSLPDISPKLVRGQSVLPPGCKVKEVWRVSLRVHRHRSDSLEVIEFEVGPSPRSTEEMALNNLMRIAVNHHKIMANFRSLLARPAACMERASGFCKKAFGNSSSEIHIKFSTRVPSSGGQGYCCVPFSRMVA